MNCPRAARKLLGLSSLGFAACMAHAPSTAPATMDSWSNVLAAARANAIDGHYDGADSSLAVYAMHHPGTLDGVESLYWRGLFKMDPANPHASIPTAITSLDAYLADKGPHEHGAEAASLRRIASQVEGLNKMVAGAPTLIRGNDSTPATRPVAAGEVVNPSTDAEIKRLKDELAKANAELDRIRKRLSQPPKPDR